MRKIMIMLFATAALPAAALAQENERPENGDRGRLVERRADDGAGANAAVEIRERQYRSTPTEQRVQPAPEVRVQAEAQAERQDRFRGGRDGFDGGRGRRFERPTQPPVLQAPAQQPDRASIIRRNFDGNNVGRDVSRNDRRDADRNDRRDFNRNDNRPDFNRNDNRPDFGRNDNRRGFDRNDTRRDAGRYDYGRGDWNAGRNDRFASDNRTRNWDRNWRSNQRYNWQSYRGANRYAYRLPRYNAPYNWNYGYRRFSVGAYLFADLFAQDYWIGNPYAYRLPPAYYPYQWVRYYNDALLIDTRSGYVVDAIQDIFWY